MNFFRLVANQVRTFPWKSQSVPCAILIGSGDAAIQLIVEKRRAADFDWLRLSRFALLGFFVEGPFLYKWYEFLEHRFGRHGFKSVVQKLALDQIVVGPVLTALVLSGLQLAEGKGWNGVRGTMRDDYTDILIDTYKVYPILQTFNFWLVPLRGQVFVDQTATVAWNAYISWKTQTVKAEPKKDTNKSGSENE